MSGLRQYFQGLQRMRDLSWEVAAPTGPTVVGIQAFIDDWLNIQVRAKKTAGGAMADFPIPAFEEVRPLVRGIGESLHAAGVKGIRFHNQFQAQVRALAPQFGLRGWVECGARCDDEAGRELPGRVDVVWAHRREPVVVFEIDSTVKLKSFWKLKQAHAPAKCWVYFGPDVWAFKTLLKAQDPEREIVPICIPNTFTPTFGK